MGAYGPLLQAPAESLEDQVGGNLFKKIIKFFQGKSIGLRKCSSLNNDGEIYV